MARPKCSTKPSPKSIWVTKLCFRIVSLIICIALGALNGYLEDNWGTFGVVMFCPPAFVSLLWGCLDIFMLLNNATHRGIHYIKVLVVDLILLLGYIAALTLYGSWEFGSRDYQSDHDEHTQSIINNIRNTVSCIAAAQILCHLGVFVIACYETHHRKRLFPDATLPSYKLDEVQAPPAYGELYSEYASHSPMNQPETPSSERRQDLDRKK